MRVLVFGASTTQGYWDTEGGWAARLRRSYDEKQVTDQAQGRRNEGQPIIFNLGISAETTSDLLKRFETETIARQREDMAFIISTGGNDSAIENKKERNTPQKFRSQVEELISKAKKYSDKIIFVGSQPVDESRTTPVFWADVHYTNARREAFDNQIIEVCKNNSIPFVSLTESFEIRMNKGEELLVDGLHPNNEGHELIFRLVRPELDKLL